MVREDIGIAVGSDTAPQREARSGLVSLFGPGLDVEMERVIASWWNPSTQSTLLALVERMKKKTG